MPLGGRDDGLQQVTRLVEFAAPQMPLRQRRFGSVVGKGCVGESGKLYRGAQAFSGVSVTGHRSKAPVCSQCSAQDHWVRRRACLRDRRGGVRARICQPPQQSAEGDCDLHAHLRGASGITPGQLVECLGQQGERGLEVGLHMRPYGGELPAQRGGNLRRPFVAEPPHLLVLPGGGEPL